MKVKHESARRGLRPGRGEAFLPLLTVSPAVARVDRWSKSGPSRQVPDVASSPSPCLNTLLTPGFSTAPLVAY